MTTPNIEPAVGDEIRLSKRKFLIAFAVLLLAFVLGIVSIWAWWTETPLPLPLFAEPSYRWSGMSGALMVAISAVFMPIMIAFYFAKERLILAADRLQMVHGSSVVAQIPYRNIASVALAEKEGVAFVGIDLQDPADPETFAEVWDFADHKANEGWHYAIQGVYERELDEILKMIEARLPTSRQA